MYQLILLAAVLVLLLMFVSPMRRKNNLLKDLTNLKTQTVNMLNKVLKTDTSNFVDFHVPDVKCGDYGSVDRIMSPDELVKLYHENLALYDDLVKCGYTRTVGLLHGFALWSSASKGKDLKSFRYFNECVKHMEWNDPLIFVNFHSPTSSIGKCIV